MHTRKMLKKKYVCREFEDVFLGRGYVLNPCPSRFSHRALISQEMNVRALQKLSQNKNRVYISQNHLSHSEEIKNM